MKKNMLEFPAANGRIYLVKERTPYSIYRFLGTYIRDAYAKYEYIPGSQKISKMNGNIYARFYIRGTDSITTLCVADYSDYIGEINFNE